MQSIIDTGIIDKSKLHLYTRVYLNCEKERKTRKGAEIAKRNEKDLHLEQPFTSTEGLNVCMLPFYLPKLRKGTKKAGFHENERKGINTIHNNLQSKRYRL